MAFKLESIRPFQKHSIFVQYQMSGFVKKGEPKSVIS